MGLVYRPNPVPYRPHRASWRQPLHLHLAPLWDALTRELAELHGRVIDVGCGHKPYAPMMGRAVSEYIGVDREGPHATPDVVGDASQLPFPDGHFDAGVSFQVFEHVRDPLACVKELARVVKPGGTVLFTVPGVWPAHEVPHDHWRYTRNGLEALLVDAGLVDGELTPLGGLWSALGQMANLELDKRWWARALIPWVNLGARALEPTAREELVLNWLVVARRP